MRYVVSWGLCWLAAAVLFVRLGYVQWWLHPEYTTAMLFWAHPWEYLGCVALLILGTAIFTRGMAANV